MEKSRGGAMIADVEAYFAKGCGRCARFATAECSTMLWRDGVRELRRICRDTGLSETLKWAHPCYVHAGRNVAIIGAFRDDFRLSFFDAALLEDRARVLQKQGPNTRHADMLRFKSRDEVVALEATIRSYLREAMGHAEAGTKPVRDRSEPEPPEELTDALAKDPELANAFAALTPGRRRSYVINLNSAKKPETRISRIASFRDRILAGKGAMER